MKKRLLIATCACAAVLAGCSDDKVKPTGIACLGTNNSSLVENMADVCKAGDTVATKHPAYVCDFGHAVAYNDYNSAICIYAGKIRQERAFLAQK